ncbi:MAG: YybH family protein [Thermoguttaceae bacterium]
MRITFFCLTAVGGLFAVGLLCVAGEPQAKVVPVSKDSSHDTDRKAILQSGRDFTAAFEKGDAKAVAALWTEQGEYENEDGMILRGRTAIEEAFAAHFKGRPTGKMEILVENIRFPSRDTAIEEGLTRSMADNTLPDSSRYRVLHVREDGKWQIVLCREWGVAENHMADLDWLLGTWRSQAKDHDMVISFARGKDGPFIIGEFTATNAGKSVSLGTMKIGLDPASGQFISWHFDPDGGYGHGSWLRERNHWVVDSRGIRGDGAETAAVNVLSRFGSDELGWRSLDRMVGGKAQPESPPIRLKRVAKTK